MTEQQQNEKYLRWPHRIEREDDFSGLTVAANILAIVTFFYRKRFVVLIALVMYCISIPSKKKVDLSIGGIFMSGIIVILSLLMAYGFNPAGYD